MEDLDGTVVGGRCEERVGSMVDDGSKRFGMVPGESKKDESVSDVLEAAIERLATHLKVL